MDRLPKWFKMFTMPLDEDAPPRIPYEISQQLQRAFHHRYDRSGMSEGHLSADVFGELLNPSLISVLYSALGGTKDRGLKCRDLLSCLSVLIYGEVRHRLDLLKTLFCNEEGVVYKEDLIGMLQEIDGDEVADRVVTDLFPQQVDAIEVERLSDYFSRYADATSLSYLILSIECQKLLYSPELPRYYRMLSGVTHLTENEIYLLDLTYSSLRSSSASGVLDLSNLFVLFKPYFPEMLTSKIFTAFDSNGDGELDLKEIVCGLSTALYGPVIERHKFILQLVTNVVNEELSAAQQGEIAKFFCDILGEKTTSETETELALFLDVGYNSDKSITVNDYLIWAASSSISESFLETFSQVLRLKFNLRNNNDDEDMKWKSFTSKEGSAVTRMPSNDPPKQIADVDKTSKIGNVNRGTAGLANTDRSCYANAALQAASHTVALTKYFRADSHMKTLTNPQLVPLYVEFLRTIWETTTTCVAPKRILNIIKEAGGFESSQDNDCQEWISTLLNVLHQELKSHYAEETPPPLLTDEQILKAMKIMMGPRSIITELFSGCYRTSITCSCGYKSFKFENFWTTSLPFPASEEQHSVHVVNQDGDSSFYCITGKVTVHQVKEFIAQTLQIPYRAIVVAAVVNGKIMRFVGNNVRFRENFIIYTYTSNDNIVPCGAYADSLKVMELSADDGDIAGVLTFPFNKPLQDYLLFTGTIIVFYRSYEVQGGPPLLPARKVRTETFSVPKLIHLSKDLTFRDIYEMCRKWASELLPTSSATATNHARDCDGSLDGEFPFSIRRVNSTGYGCPVCRGGSFCTGCPLQPSSSVFTSDDGCVAIDFEGPRSHLRLDAALSEQMNTDLNQENSIKHCLGAYCAPESLLGYKCDQCKRSNECIKETDFFRLPPILVFCLQRFEVTNQGVQVTRRPVHVPLDLDMKDFVTKQSEEVLNSYSTLPGGRDLHRHRILPGSDSNDLTYEAFAMICHRGIINAGHYTCYASHESGQWYHFNDHLVDRVSPSSIPSSEIYVIFYKRKILNDAAYALKDLDEC